MFDNLEPLTQRVGRIIKNPFSQLTDSDIASLFVNGFFILCSTIFIVSKK